MEKNSRGAFSISFEFARPCKGKLIIAVIIAILGVACGADLKVLVW